MNYVGRFFSSVKTLYSEINPATLTGAIDVVVVEQEDGSLLCSPFHVRFGKMGVLRSREKVVYIEINGEQVDLHMKLGENGEAFFLEEVAVEDQVPVHLCSSPIVSTAKLMEQGIKRLHEEASSIRSETESSKESDTSLVVDIKVTEVPRLPQEHITPIVTVEALCSSPRNVSDEETASSGNKDPAAATRDPAAATGDPAAATRDPAAATEDPAAATKDPAAATKDPAAPIKDPAAATKDPTAATAKQTLIRIESESKSNRRTKVVKKRKRRSGKGNSSASAAKPESDAAALLPSGGKSSSLSHRMLNLSESSTSSSQHSDEDEDGEEIFQMEDVSEEEGDVERGVPRGAFKVNKKGQPSKAAWEEMLPVDLVKVPQHPLSDGDVTPCLLSPSNTRPPTPKSDTELEISRKNRPACHIRSASSSDKMEWNWGELPESMAHLKPLEPDDDKTKDGEEDEPISEGAEADPEGGQLKTGERKSMWSKLNVFKNIHHSHGVEKGMYLQDLASEEVDPEVYALYFPERTDQSNRLESLRDEDKSSDLGTSLPQSPSTVQETSSGTEYGDESESSMELQISLCGTLKDEEENVSQDLFLKHLVTYEEFSKSPGLLSNPSLVVRVDGKYYNWQAAGPIIISYLAFRRPLPEPVVTTLVKGQAPKGKLSLTSWLWGPSKTQAPKKEANLAGEPVQPESDETRQREETVYWSDESCERATEPTVPSSQSQSSSLYTYKKSIRLSSDNLAKLNLKPGPNVIRYSVTTRYQGTTDCKSTVYLWKHDSNIIISDIDGTITRSDVFGQILPVLGKDWTHWGVAQLFSQIRQNGYHFMYLSARAIGQAHYTKGYLKSVCQDKFDLPDGPLLLNPSSLLRAFHREVIIKNPEEFKIRCLKDIQSLFPSTSTNSQPNPFYAGFGNRINDTWAYRAVGVPLSRIFTINSQGKLTQELIQTFQSSYPMMRGLVEHVFPSVHRQETMAFVSPHDYSSFTFWREPVQEIAVEDELLKSAS